MLLGRLPKGRASPTPESGFWPHGQVSSYQCVSSRVPPSSTASSSDSRRERRRERPDRQLVEGSFQTLPGLGIEPRHAHEPRALMELVSAVEAIEPDVAVVPLRALGAPRCRDPRSGHRNVIVGASRDTSHDTEVPSGASGKPLSTRYFPTGSSRPAREVFEGIAGGLSACHWPLVRMSTDRRACRRRRSVYTPGSVSFHLTSLPCSCATGRRVRPSQCRTTRRPQYRSRSGTHGRQ